MRAPPYLRLLIGPVAAAIVGGVVLVGGRDLIPMPVPGVLGLLLVLLASYFGGLASGLLTGAVAVCVAAFMLAEPGMPLRFQPEAPFRLAVLVVTAPVIAVIVSLLQTRAHAALAAERMHRERLQADNRELETLRAAIDQINLGVLLLDHELRVRFISRAMSRVGDLPENIVEIAPTLRGLLELACRTGIFPVPQEKQKTYINARIAQVQAGDPYPRELRLGNGDIARMQCAVLPDGGRLLTYTLVTDLVRQAEELKNLRNALEQINYGVLLLDRDMCVEYINEAVRELGNLARPLPGTKPRFEDLIRQVAENGRYAISPAERDAYVADRVAWVRQENPPPFDIRTADGRITRVSCIVLRDGARMLIYTDETDALRHVDELEELASVDTLTGLHNRRYFDEAATREWARFERYRRPLSLLIIDVDRFKLVNDRFGHDAGDAVLREIGAVCREIKRDADVVARIGGEEFAVLLPETGPDKALAAAERIRKAMAARPMPLGMHQRSITVSIGVATANTDVADVGALIKQADVALYAAKNAGRDRVTAFPPANNAKPATAA